MDAPKPVLKSILVTTLFTLVVVGLTPFLLLQAEAFDWHFQWGFFHLAAIATFILGAAVSLM